MPGELFIGLMSGTSMDGIDAALVDFADHRPRLIAARTHPWPRSLRLTLQQLASGEPCSLETLGRADAAAGDCLADAALALLDGTPFSADQIDAIGSHGQTLHHGPDGDDGFTLQIGDANRIAERTGITTVADLRRRDIAAGGQGAPLVSAFHDAYLAEPGEQRAVLNIGGIANLTLLPGDAGAATGFDTGPGNCLMDTWIASHDGRTYDRDGAWGASGAPIPALLAQLAADPYFAAATPKTTGTQYFSPDWLRRQLGDWQDAAARDIQATLAALTVQSIRDALLATQPDTGRLLVCGGGRHNALLMSGLARALPDVQVVGTESAGLDPDNLEAMAFAWLARQRLLGQAGNLPSVTGARHPVVLGAVYPG